ncbi:MAG: hypothetical protein JW896_13340 [Deltaproteobacteria bacterium]|nr:hypothetical protein [Deltaproteobacteria bacterium]
MTHPKSSRITEAVRAGVNNAFSPELRSEALDTFSRYGIEAHEREIERVQLAIVIFCGGNMDKLAALVTEAKKYDTQVHKMIRRLLAE